MLEIVIKMISGLFFFFVGLHLTEKGFVQGTGDKLKQILEICTGNLISAVITGTLVTAVVQSSSAVSVIVIGLVTGGIMTLRQGMGIIIGANVGTTMTLHILTLQINALEWWLLGLGVVMIVWGWVESNHRVQNGGLAVLGFGLIFLGMSGLESAAIPLQFHSGVTNWLARFSIDPISGVVFGTIVTAILQSSSAVSGIVLTIATQGMLNLTGAVGIILGANIGTCATALLAGIKGSKLARRVAYFHVLFNCFGVLLFLPFISGFVQLISLSSADLGRQIAIGHTFFNLITAIIILPFVKYFEKMLTIK